MPPGCSAPNLSIEHAAMNHPALEPVLIPVYRDQNGIAQIRLYQLTAEGVFKPTAGEPLRSLRDNIVGASLPVGELLSTRFDRSQRGWSTPTLLPVSGRPQSVYRYLRNELAHNRLPVGMTASEHGRLQRMSIHCLQLKPNISAGVRGLLMRKYSEAIRLFHEAPEQVVMEGYSAAYA